MDSLIVKSESMDSQSSCETTRVVVLVPHHIAVEQSLVIISCMPALQSPTYGDSFRHLASV